MSRVRCRTCKGEYDTTTADGLPYMHVCPPVRAIKVRHADGTREIVAPEAVVATDEQIAEIYLPRKQGRDERPDLENRDARGVPRIKAEGRGVTPIPDDVVPIVGLPDAV